MVRVGADHPLVLVLDDLCDRLVDGADDRARSLDVCLTYPDAFPVPCDPVPESRDVSLVPAE